MSSDKVMTQAEVVRHLEAVGLQATVSVIGPMAKGCAEHWTALLTAAARVEALKQALIWYVDLYGGEGMHDDPKCPEDDTCECEKVRIINDLLREGGPPHER